MSDDNKIEDLTSITNSFIFKGSVPSIIEDIGLVIGLKEEETTNLKSFCKLLPNQFYQKILGLSKINFQEIKTFENEEEVPVNYIIENSNLKLEIDNTALLKALRSCSLKKKEINNIKLVTCYSKEDIVFNKINIRGIGYSFDIKEIYLLIYLYAEEKINFEYNFYLFSETTGFIHFKFPKQNKKEIVLERLNGIRNSFIKENNFLIKLIK